MRWSQLTRRIDGDLLVYFAERRVKNGTIPLGRLEVLRSLPKEERKKALVDWLETLNDTLP